MPELHPLPSDALAGLEVRTEYSWSGSGPAHNHQFLLPTLRSVLGPGQDHSLIDLGCGNGSLTANLAALGFDTYGIDVAGGGIQHAVKAHPSLPFTEHDLGLPLAEDLRGTFDIAFSAEVIEHMFLPRELFRRANEALTDRGRFIVTTPYHGWLKNVALAVTGRMDQHWNPGWDYGHVKFFSKRTLTELARECGFEMAGFHRAGRIPALAMSMIVEFRRA